jgi:hypothetical protein
MVIALWEWIGDLRICPLQVVEAVAAMEDPPKSLGAVDGVTKKKDIGSATFLGKEVCVLSKT